MNNIWGGDMKKEKIYFIKKNSSEFPLTMRGTLSQINRHFQYVLEYGNFMDKEIKLIHNKLKLLLRQINKSYSMSRFNDVIVTVCKESEFNNSVLTGYNAVSLCEVP